MSLILNIETATKNCSVALSHNGKTVLCKEISGQGYSHAEKLHVFINEIISESGHAFADLQAIAVSRGPGSYTGLRIGVSAAKGLCFALGIPLISIDTLKVLAASANISDGVIIPMLDARRMEVYSSVFSPDLTEIRKTEAEILTEDSFSDVGQTAYFLGDANEKAKSVLTKSNFVFLDGIVFPSASEMAALSFDKFQKNEFEDVAYFEPFYLKDFVVGGK
ncbi:tRNA (adenosine(37)-N6)-threonylcarbamoyltransferase complex dimerization subunit type 1 TsaB [Flavobacterium sp. MAH-1]|uniref:tRNA (Adenosine(37)-N6)-threonylcarbamoyltransferase complex dimerization subunit type 1 TsaB n=1 Tax=Flavobacterium agri TaxID=2743471 RepID=A0A7Y8Y371_9FLAO|nr:tRNA (adenosine(37)-N6)-threonylcarbamoyltransferase complex dimerization subunit type 1 TsaB [Flavobacterium agri]NUY81622.1 tRNA (adenosine(37)-N6)-threonylcarbamoyltransferase complex dimerization subunit type 1 TsaB [Flavobacterium agri]NYA71646.1 tRNA (adenosine(37)-N6)-threonylcarbamoyltransferase complex dimerization subunit type 1 TsaB [Flavobacterium agri]